MEKTNYCLWLGLEKSLEQDLQTLISRLAARYKTQPFIPHATLLTSINTTLDELERVTEQLAKTTTRLNTCALGLGYSDEYYRNFYIQLPLIEPLENLHIESKTLLRTKTTQPYQPHVSLLYGFLSSDEQRRLSIELGASYPKNLEFSQLIVVDTSSDISNWKITSRVDLEE